jgi:hypothetical protein
MEHEPIEHGYGTGTGTLDKASITKQRDTLTQIRQAYCVRAATPMVIR